MEVKNLKLHIINKIVETENEALLQTILKLLELNTAPSALQEVSAFPSESEDKSSPAAQELQQEIDHLFEIK